SEHSAQVHVVKCHEYREDISAAADIVTMTTRDFRDIEASAIRFGLIAPTWPDIRAFLDNEAAAASQWSACASMILPYNRIVEAPLDCISLLVDLLQMGQGVPAGEVLAAMPTPGGKYDQTTKLWPNHITDGRVGAFSETLSSALTNQIHRHYPSR